MRRPNTASFGTAGGGLGTCRVGPPWKRTGGSEHARYEWDEPLASSAMPNLFRGAKVSASGHWADCVGELAVDGRHDDPSRHWGCDKPPFWLTVELPASHRSTRSTFGRSGTTSAHTSTSSKALWTALPGNCWPTNARTGRQPPRRGSDYVSLAQGRVCTHNVRRELRSSQRTYRGDRRPGRPRRDISGGGCPGGSVEESRGGTARGVRLC